MKLILATSVAALLSSTAFAGSVNTPAPTVVAVAPADASVDWSGAYIGGTYAFAFGDNEYYEDGSVSALYPLEGNAYGAFAGYRRDLGSFVLGGEAAVLFAGGIFESDEEPAYAYETIIDLKATAGYDLGNVLVYATAGYSVASFYQGGENTMSGFLVGAGADVKVGERFFVGAEYIYRDVSNDDFWDPNNGLGGQISTVQLRAGVNF